jgi:hypothetical protein
MCKTPYRRKAVAARLQARGYGLVHTRTSVNEARNRNLTLYHGQKRMTYYEASQTADHLKAVQRLAYLHPYVHTFIHLSAARLVGKFRNVGLKNVGLENIAVHSVAKITMIEVRLSRYSFTTTFRW